MEPRKTTEYSAITRPRNGPAASCSDELTPAANVTLAAPVSASTAICTACVGAAAASSCAAPNTAALPTSRRAVTLPRQPEASAPAIDPTPIAAISAA